MAEAQRVTIGLGQIVSDVNMALTTTRTARITGTRGRLAGAADDGLRVMAMPRGESMMMMFGAPNQIRPDGTFSIGGLAPGTYVLQTQGGAMGPDGESASPRSRLAATTSTGVRLVGSKPSTASGRVIVEPGSAQSVAAVDASG